MDPAQNQQGFQHFQPSTWTQSPGFPGERKLWDTQTSEDNKAFWNNGTRQPESMNWVNSLAPSTFGQTYTQTVPAFGQSYVTPLPDPEPMEWEESPPLPNLRPTFGQSYAQTLPTFGQSDVNSVWSSSRSFSLPCPEPMDWEESPPLQNLSDLRL